MTQYGLFYKKDLAQFPHFVEIIFGQRFVIALFHNNRQINGLLDPPLFILKHLSSAWTTNINLE